jgi:hypothetical protein
MYILTDHQYFVHEHYPVGYLPCGIMRTPGIKENTMIKSKIIRMNLEEIGR